jgi:hypothetical protein
MTILYTENEAQKDHPEQKEIASLVVQTLLTEQSPLMFSTNRPGGADQNGREDPLLLPVQQTTAGLDHSNMPTPPLRKRWNRLKEQVGSGNFLLSSVGNWIVDDQDGKEKKRRDAQEKIRFHTEFTLLQCIFWIFGYIAVSVLAFSFILDHWTIVDSAYFAVVTFTTIGYGDLVPDTHAGRIFTCFFTLSGVICLGIALGVVGNNLVEAQAKAVERAGEISKYRVTTLFSNTDEDNNKKNNGNDNIGSSSSHPADNSAQEGLLPQQAMERQVRTQAGWMQNPLWRILREFLMVVAILLTFAMLIADDPGVNINWNVGTAMYYTISKYWCAGLSFLDHWQLQSSMVLIISIFIAVS